LGAEGRFWGPPRCRLRYLVDVVGGASTDDVSQSPVEFTEELLRVPRNLLHPPLELPVPMGLFLRCQFDLSPGSANTVTVEPRRAARLPTTFHRLLFRWPLRSILPRTPAIDPGDASPPAPTFAISRFDTPMEVRPRALGRHPRAPPSTSVRRGSYCGAGFREVGGSPSRSPETPPAAESYRIRHNEPS
jgi:hypothetical protein